MATDFHLLKEYAEKNSQDAFSTVVQRHVNLVYSAALRQVRSPHLAEEITQSVFTDLARSVDKLQPETVLSAWLYQVARRTAIDVIRREARRHVREQIAAQLMNSPSSEWNSIESLLDEAMDSLDISDRAAILLRYFENKSLREVGQALGTTDDAAQKRVSRAIERLRDFFSKHGVAIGMSALAAAISTNAVQAAPVGLAMTISTAAVSAMSATAAITATKTIAMTIAQKTIISAALITLAGAGVYEAHQSAQRQSEIESLRWTEKVLTTQLAKLTSANNQLSNQLAHTHLSNSVPKAQLNELSRLRGLARLNAQQIAELKAALEQGQKLPDSLSKILNRSYAAFENQEKQWQKNNVGDRLRQLTDKLSLTPQQQQQIRDILATHSEAKAELEIASYTGTASLEEISARRTKLNEDESTAFAGVLSAEQMTALKELEAAEQDQGYHGWARSMAAQNKSTLNLTPEQQEQMASVLYSLKPGLGGKNIPGYSNAEEQLDMRIRALQSVLSAEQLQGYRQKLEDDIEEHRQIATIVKALKQSEAGQ